MNSKQLLMLILVAGVLGVSAAFTLDQSPFKLRPLKTFYVVAYYWGFVFYDENFNEIPYMVVNRGDEVQIMLIPANVIIKDPILSAREGKVIEYQNRTLWKGIGDLQPGDPRIEEEMVKAHLQGLGDHSMVIEGYNVVAVTCSLRCGVEHRVRESIQQTLNEAAAAIGSVKFIADKQGTFAVYCSIYCGYGHNYQRVDNALIVR
ncbi:MAG: hypothetical protein QW470_07550 [Candidatus Caldarchaeum sp.]